MYGTLHFSLAGDPKLACTCGHPECDRRTVAQEHLERLERVRVWLDTPLRVTSGGRCPLHPNEVHRTKPADHQRGYGIDIACDGSTRGNLVALGLRAGFNAIGVAKTFVHLGYREDLPKAHTTMWVY